MARSFQKAGIVGVLAMAALLAASSTAAQARRTAPTVWEREVQRLHDEVVRRSREPAAIVPLIELASRWELAPARTTALVHALAEDRRLPATLRAYARSFEAVLLRRAGERERAQEVGQSLGYVRRFRVVGPFDNTGRRGFSTVLPPERALSGERDGSAEYQGLERMVRWETLPELGTGEAVPLWAFFTPSDDVCVFAETFVELDRARPIALFAGAAGAMRLWWNGEQTLEDPVYRAADSDRVAALAVGRAGWNHVLVKVCSASQGLGLVLRIAEPDGTPIPGVRADPDGARAPSPPPATAIALPAARPLTTLAQLEAQIAARPDDADAHEALARYLDYTGGSDPTTPRVLDLAVRATELRPTVRNLLFAAEHQLTRAESARFIERARALAPRDPEVALAHAVHVLEGPSGERGLRLLEAIPPDTPAGLDALFVRARVLARLELVESSHALYEQLVRLAPGAPAYLRALIESEEARGHVARASELRRELLAIHTDDSETRRALVSEALARSDRELALELTRDEVARYPVSISTMLWASRIFDALAEETEAIEVLRRATDIDHGNPSTRVALGRMLLRFDHREAALAALREALALRPQDGATRRLVEQIEPEARPDEAYATPIETILARRRPDGEWPATVLHDVEVHTVRESGLGSSFRQVVMQIHDEEGARANRSFAFSYEPGTQWVEVRSARVHRDGEVLSSYELGERALAQPAHRIYYSARQVVVTFPVLQPGDVVEIRYRVEDVAARSQYADYFGAMRPLQRSVPALHVEHVFLTPTSRRFFFHAPAQGVIHEQRTEGDVRLDRFVARDVPPLRSEPGMPGYAEIAPYIHVSTYETWEEVARFWWGLAETQLEPDASLERTVRELIAGAPDVRTRVQRIYAWATDRVRYVGLELGIHGHKPYRVTDVVERGFGDCKDTAALLYTMLRIAGIDARIALVRTRPNGEIGTQPASLAVFDHAIAYVPELDLFLDGTAEHGGTDELPSMDQGALALIVGPSSSELRSLPVRTAESNGQRRDLVVELAPDGTATVRGREELRGGDAMRARATYDAAGTRRERLSRSLATLFPGIELHLEAFDTIDDREQPVRYTWEARVPRFGERDGEIVRIAPSALGNLTQRLAPLPTRRFPLVLGPPFHYHERRVIPLGTLRAVEVPESAVAESPFGRVSVRYLRSGREIAVETQLEVTRERVSPQEYPAFRAWVERADALLRARIAIGGVR